ncbi:hypothetical protein SASPL_147263 [Salvia splendens]|uniref:Myb/SANT-like domain-containing protein n=1 Tax=Salvia splendens TaxID=180675 RepID=A0A8X8WEV8_SALSN|nr:uncharacterized protein LOC121776111 [Salvia splendens]KAG6393033.1 hypothetical protein SASPL_147263 [Salvia splendens]
MPSQFLYEAQAAIQSEVGCRISRDDLYDRLHVLEQRYRTFKYIDDLPSTYWDIHRGKVVASDEVWKSIIKKNNFASAYYYRDDPEFPQLESLFGEKATKPERNRSVIVISDSTCPVSDGGGSKAVKPVVSEEVTSPVGADLLKSRRKLFTRELGPLDVDSINYKGHNYYAIGPKEEKKYKFEDVYPPRPRQLDGKKPINSYGSSCGSSTPIKRNLSK